MSSGSMVEKVARVIDAEAWAAIDDGRDAIPDALWHIRRSFARNRARAALEALREPDGAMIRAMLRELGAKNHRPLGPMWRAAIDAALVGEKEGERG